MNKMADTITILEDEHKHILMAIDELEKAISKDKLAESDRKRIKNSAHIFVEAEKHHEREEKILFPAIEAKGVCGPTQVMREEHAELRKRKKQLFEKTKGKFEVKDILEPAEYIIENLRSHISKEDNILYNIAREVLSKKEIAEMRKKFDKIGYCCFHPVKT